MCVVLIYLASSWFSLCWREENWDFVYVTVSLFCSHTWLIVWVGLGSNSFSSHYQCYWWEIWYQADSYTFVGNNFSSLKLLQCLGVCVFSSFTVWDTSVPFWSENLFSTAFENSVCYLFDDVLPYVSVLSF